MQVKENVIEIPEKMIDEKGKYLISPNNVLTLNELILELEVRIIQQLLKQKNLKICGIME